MSIRTPKLIALLFTLFACLALAAFTACGDDDDNKNSATATSHATGTGGSGNNTGQATNEPTNTEEASGSSDDILSELQNLGNDIEQVTGKVTYSSTEENPGETASTTTFTFYSKDDKSRFDSVDSDGSTT